MGQRPSVSTLTLRLPTHYLTWYSPAPDSVRTILYPSTMSLTQKAQRNQKAPQGNLSRAKGERSYRVRATVMSLGVRNSTSKLSQSELLVL